MQVSFNNNDDVEGIKIPQYDVGRQVLFFDHVKGRFATGIIVQFQLVKTEQYQTIAYGIRTYDNNVLPCIPESLVFTDRNKAKDWINKVNKELDKI